MKAGAGALPKQARCRVCQPYWQQRPMGTRNPGNPVASGPMKIEIDRRSARWKQPADRCCQQQSGGMAKG
jgi:hypothetical protein